MPFNPDAIGTFRLVGHEYVPAEGRALFRYALDQHEFCEEVVFHGAKKALGRAEKDALESCLSIAHLLSGVSYYKAAAPHRIEVASGPLSPATADLLELVYVKGLAEYAYCNDLDLAERVRFPRRADGLGSAPVKDVLEPGFVVPMGGGKDSLVSVDLLRKSGLSGRLISVGQATRIDTVAATVPWPHVRISRRLDPALLTLNDDGALNGHVPISAIIAGLLLCAAVVYGYDTVVMSNERSAEAPNVTAADGSEVNHQFSKSWAFERAWQGLVRREILPQLRYFSLLRPWSELAICRYFAGLPGYHGVFSSCNGNFRQADKQPQRWCGACPKCRFVFLALAPFLPRAQVIEIFAADLLDDPAQRLGFEALLGLRAFKPFECVGEIGECRAAFAALSEHPEWRDAAVVSALRDAVAPTWFGLQQWLAPAQVDTIPEEFRGIAHALG